MSLNIRLYQPEDFDAVILLWRRAREDSLPEFQRTKGHTFEEDCTYFRDVILRNNQVWVAEPDGTVAGFMAINGSLVDQLYIAPNFQHRGIGQAFLAHAHNLSPEFLRLYTLQINTRARAFYEKNGFRAVKFGISPPPESEPDVEYHWP
jgi:ribosomal protein S18 acetylase RimI-like enzyme